jgi:hypothetical protein
MNPNAEARMQTPDYYLPRPQFDLTPDKKAAFEELFLSTLAGSRIAYRLPYPKWEYLTYLCETRDVVLHGSQVAGIEVVEPRQAHDIKSFSNQRSIYATTDGIWVIYFAIIDRKKYSPLSLFNSCFRAGVLPDQLSEPFYFFSITHSALLQKPWCEGAVYILPRQSFEQEAAQHMQGVDVVFPHWISASPARPIAFMPVGPQDFPFLNQVHGHNDQKLVQLAAADPNGYPWPEALES